jgi:hypothetical protein
VRYRKPFGVVMDPLTAAGVGEPGVMGDLDPSALVAVVAASHRLRSMLVARRLAAVAALLGYRVRAAEQADIKPGYAVIDGLEQTAAEVAGAMNLSAMAAVTWCRTPRHLVFACPRSPHCSRRAEPIGHRATDHRAHRPNHRQRIDGQA